MTTHSFEKRTFRVTVPSEDAGAFVAAMSRAHYPTADSGERITTDDGIDSEAVFLLTVPNPGFARVDRVQNLLAP